MNKIFAENKKARFEYFFIEKFEAGIVLTGSEVKSIRMGGAELVNSYISIEGGSMEVFTNGLKVRRPKTTIDLSFNSERQKKLLLKKKQILRLFTKSKERGLTIVPLSLYFNSRGFAKLEIAIAKGKQLYDKRRDIKLRDLARQERKEKL